MIRYRKDRPSPYLSEVRGPDGRRVTRSFRTKREAKLWEEDQRVAIRRGEWVDPRAGQITVREWLEQVEAGKLDVTEQTRATRAYMIRHINDGLGDWPIGRLTPEAIQAWVADLDRSPGTVRKAYAILGEALKLAVARGRIVRDPNILIKLPALVEPDHRYLTEHQLLELAEVMPPRYKPFVYLGGYGGLRPGEAFAVEWGDLSGNLLRVRGTKTRTSRRTIRIPPILVEALTDHRQTYPHVQWILHNQMGHQVNLRSFRDWQWQRAVQNSVGEPMRPYDLRHTHVALLIEQGMHAKGIAERLGHATITTTMDTYGHLLEGVGDDAIDRLGYPNAQTNNEQDADTDEAGT